MGGYTFENEEALLSFFGLESREGYNRVLYKATVCGASCTMDEAGITYHTIVEGSDAEFSSDKLLYPVTADAMDDAVHELELLALAEWIRSNPDADHFDEEE